VPRWDPSPSGWEKSPEPPTRSPAAGYWKRRGFCKWINNESTNWCEFQNYFFFKYFFLTLTLIRLILSAAYFHAWVPWAQNLQDFEIPLDTETNGTTHVLVRGPWEQLFRYDMGDKSLAQPPKTSQNRRFAIIDPQIGLIPSPKWIVWFWNRQNMVETHLPKPNSQAPQVCLISSGVEQYWNPVLVLGMLDPIAVHSKCVNFTNR